MIEIAGKKIATTLAEIVEPSRTARSARKLAYDVVVVKDCVGSRNSLQTKNQQSPIGALLS